MVTRSLVAQHTHTRRSLRRTVLLHHLEELHDDLRRRADEHLALATLLRIGDRLQAIGEHTHAHHLEGERRRAQRNQTMRRLLRRSQHPLWHYGGGADLDGVWRSTTSPRSHSIETFRCCHAGILVRKRNSDSVISHRVLRMTTNESRWRLHMDHARRCR